MKLPAAAYSAEVATSLRRLEAAGYLAKFSDPSARAFGRRAEAAASAAKAGHPLSELRGIRRRRINLILTGLH